MIFATHSGVWEGNVFSRGCLSVSHSVHITSVHGKLAVGLKRLSV